MSSPTRNVDPLELRLINYSDKDQIEDKPYSSKQLRECYRQGAEKFGWSRAQSAAALDEDGPSWSAGWRPASGKRCR